MENPTWTWINLRHHGSYSYMESNQCICSPPCHPAASSHYCTVCEARNQRITQRGRIGELVVTHVGVALCSCCRTLRRGLVGSDHCFSRNHFRTLNAPITTGLKPYRQAVLSRSKPGYAHKSETRRVRKWPLVQHLCTAADKTQQDNTTPTHRARTDTHPLTRINSSASS